MSSDNLCKYLSEKYPDRFATWLLGYQPASPVQVLKTELSIENFLKRQLCENR